MGDLEAASAAAQQRSVHFPLPESPSQRSFYTQTNKIFSRFLDMPIVHFTGKDTNILQMKTLLPKELAENAGGGGAWGRTENAKEAAELGVQVPPGCSGLGGGGGGARAKTRNRASDGRAQPATSTVLGLAPVSPAAGVRGRGVLAGILAPGGPR